MRHDILVGDNRRLKLMLTCIFLFSFLSTSFAASLPKSEALKQIKKNNPDKIVTNVCFQQSSYPCYFFYNFDKSVYQKISDAGLGTLVYNPYASGNCVESFTAKGNAYLSAQDKGECRDIYIGAVKNINITGIRSSNSSAEVEYAVELTSDSPFSKVLLDGNKIKGSASFDKYDDGWRYSQTRLQGPYSFKKIEIPKKAPMPSANNPDIVNICKKYGVNKNIFTTGDDDGSIIISNGKKIKPSDIKWINIVEGESIDYPLNNNIKIKLDSFNLDTVNNKQFFVAKYTVTNGGKTSKLLSLAGGGMGFPAKVGNCYFINSSYGVIDGSGISLQSVDKSNGKKSAISIKQNEAFNLENGASIKIIESTSTIQNFMPEYSGPAARIEYTGPDGNNNTFMILKNKPELSPKELPYEFILDSLGNKVYVGLQSYCN